MSDRIRVDIDGDALEGFMQMHELRIRALADEPQHKLVGRLIAMERVAAFVSYNPTVTRDDIVSIIDKLVLSGDLTHGIFAEGIQQQRQDLRSNLFGLR